MSKKIANLKEKIAISIDAGLLHMIDSKIDGSIIRSRSQAIELFLRKGMEEKNIDTAVILLHKEHHDTALKLVKGKTLINTQLDFFIKNGIKKVIIVTQHSKSINLLLQAISHSDIETKIVEKETSGNADALKSASEYLKGSFVVMSGDTYNDFNLLSMIKKHIDAGKLATMGIMSIDKSSKYGTAIMDGDLIVDFEEKPRMAKTHIANTGIYIFKPEVLELCDSHTTSLEKDLFPKLARIKQLAGFFTLGEYLHLG